MARTFFPPDHRYGGFVVQPCGMREFRPGSPFGTLLSCGREPVTLGAGHVASLLLALAFCAAACGSDQTAPPLDNGIVSSQPDDTEPEPATVDTDDPAPKPGPDEGTETDDPGFSFADVDAAVEAFVDDRNLSGAGLIIVHRDLGVIHHEHWGVYDEDRTSLIASSTKMVTAGVLLRLQDDGLLDIDVPVAEYVEWGAGNSDITTAQLLSNSSGLIGLLEPNPYTCMWVSGTTLQACAAEIMTTESDDDGVIAPDTRFRYGGAQWQVAGGVAEAVSGKTWYELIDEIYIQPCELEVFGYSSPFDQVQMDGFNHPPGFDNNPEDLEISANPSMEAGAYTNTADYGKLLLMHLRGGMCGDVSVLSTEALALMHGDRIGAVYGGDAFGSGSGYGMGWWIDRDNGHISDGGAFGSTPWLDLEDGYGVLVLTESNSGTSGQLADEIRELVDTAIAEGLA